jgi:hypothetical protein
VAVAQLNSLPLPAALVEALGAGTWLKTAKHWTAVFPAGELSRPQLYSERLLHLANEAWRIETDPVFVGVADGTADPGALDPARSMLIGEVQGDAPIALDYRAALQSPTVAFLDGRCRWIKVADSFDDFWRVLTCGK